MPQPVQVRPLTAAAGGGLPADPLQRLAESQRAASYQNAFIKAGWRNWELAIKEAEFKARIDSQNYQFKLDYLKTLQTALTTANKDLTDIETSRQKTLADLETERFKSAAETGRLTAKQETEAAKTAVEQKGALYRAQLAQAGAAARQEQRLAAAAETAVRKEGEKETEKVSKKYPSEDLLKNLEGNKRLVGERSSAFYGNNAVVGESTQGYFDRLNSDISANPLASKDNTDRLVSNLALFDQMASTKASRDGISYADAARQIKSALEKSGRTDIIETLKAARDVVEPKPTITTTSTSTTTGGKPSSVAGGAIPSMPALNIGGAPGTTYKPTSPLEPTMATEVGQGAYGSAQEAAKKRIAELQATIAALGAEVASAPSGQIIRPAQQIYRKEFLQPSIPATKAKVDILMTTPDPWSSHKADATDMARQMLQHYAASLENPMAQKQWTSWEMSPVASAVRDLVSKTKVEDLSHAKEVLATRYPTAVTKQEDIDRAKEAMTAFLVYSQLKKQGRKVQSGSLESMSPYEY